jgi:membrane protease YdiL (CAAX protease family)
MTVSKDYFQATRHPWPILIVMLPLLIAYESGVLIIGGAKSETLRNGADAWMRWALQSFGMGHLIVAPMLIAIVFAIWSYVRRADRPEGLLTVCTGMTLECFLFALVLWGLSHAFAPFLEVVGVPLGISVEIDPLVTRIITFVGAGIYEEILFRLILFSGLAWLLRLSAMPKWGAIAAAVVVSSLLFAAAHHVGPFGEKMDSYVFLFRMMAGVYFAVLFHFRGFGIAAGAHACYDVLVGLVPN